MLTKDSMKTLHILNKALSAPDVVNRCLSSTGQDDALLLIEDAVYAVIEGSSMATAFLNVPFE